MQNMYEYFQQAQLTGAQRGFQNHRDSRQAQTAATKHTFS